MTEDLAKKLDTRLSKIDRVKPNEFATNETVSNLTLKVFAGVFNPNKGKSSKLMIKALNFLDLSKIKSALEIGTGCGLLSILLAQKEIETIVATDISDAALENARVNFDEHSINAKLIKSDLFTEISEEFDLVLFNAPASHPKRAGNVPGSVSLWDPTCKTKDRFINQLENHLSKDGIAICMYSKYYDFDPFKNLQIDQFHSSYLFVEIDEISETGILILQRKI